MSEAVKKVKTCRVCGHPAHNVVDDWPRDLGSERYPEYLCSKECARIGVLTYAVEQLAEAIRARP